MIDTFYASSLEELLRLVLQCEPAIGNTLYFRGESEDYGLTALIPSIYRDKHLAHEHTYYREMQRFNDHEFVSDKTAFDKLARMQHYLCPTRLIDMSKDLMSAAWFALEKRQKQQAYVEDAVLYVLEIRENKIKYYDSDAVSVVANLAKTPLDNKHNIEKSKRSIWRDAINYLGQVEEYNQAQCRSRSYLMHDIKEEKAYFEDDIVPAHLFSVFCVKPKYSNQRVHGQKGAFLLFGMNKQDVEKPISLMEEINKPFMFHDHPIEKITKIILDRNIKLAELEKIGVTKPYIYPELEKVSEFLKDMGIT